MKPVIAISAGDPSGIGPEVVVANLAHATTVGRPIVFGHLPTLRACIDEQALDLPIDWLGELAPPAAGRISVVDTGPACPPRPGPGPDNAAAQLQALERAVDAVIGGVADLLVTAPVSKAEIARLRPGFTGHTEYLAARAGRTADDVTMVFTAERLAVGLIATHLALADVPASITGERYARTVAHVRQVLDGLELPRPRRIGVAALNPHGGEGGLLGAEEREVIGPACAALRGQIDDQLDGPIPADTLFREALAGVYQGVVAAYHDQAMIPLKLGGLGKTANVTLGLPFVRTSPDHGVAYDRAGRNAADPAGMALALEVGVRLWQRAR